MLLEANDNNATRFLTSALHTLITQIKIIHNSEKFYILYNKDIFCSFTNNSKWNAVVLNVQTAVSELLIIKLVYSSKGQIFRGYFYNKLWEKFNWKYKAQSIYFTELASLISLKHFYSFPTYLFFKFPEILGIYCLKVSLILLMILPSHNIWNTVVPGPGGKRSGFSALTWVKLSFTINYIIINMQNLTSPNFTFLSVKCGP